MVPRAEASAVWSPSRTASAASSSRRRSPRRRPGRPCAACRAGRRRRRRRRARRPSAAASWPSRTSSVWASNRPSVTRPASSQGASAACAADGTSRNAAAAASETRRRPRTASVLELEPELARRLRDLAGDRLGVALRLGAERVRVGGGELLAALLLGQQPAGELVQLLEVGLGLGAWSALTFSTLGWIES